MADERSGNIVDTTANLTIAWLNNPNVRPTAEDVATFMESVHARLLSLSGGSSESGGSQGPAQPAEEAPEYEPAVTVRKSLGSREHIISLIDGKPYKSLKRHLGSHGLTPAQYRERYGLKDDYPMVAPAYAEKRRALAKKIGLGRKPGEAAPGRKAATAKTSPSKAGRKPRAAKAKS
jgi:predicted transcriptional regulator